MYAQKKKEPKKKSNNSNKLYKKRAKANLKVWLDIETISSGISAVLRFGA